MESVRAHSDDDVVTVHLTGDIDPVTAPVMTETLRAAVERDPRPRGVVADLTDVPFLDSSGLSALLSAARYLREQGVWFRVAIPENAPTRRVVELVGLTEALNVMEPDAP
jgi:anti-sigma B factor antagonist